MKILASTSILVVLLAGCASGGGGSSKPGPAAREDPALQPLRPGYEPSPCGRLYGYPVPCVSRFPRFPGDPAPSTYTPVPDFESWSSLPRNTLVGTEQNIIAMSKYSLAADGSLAVNSVGVSGGKYGELIYGYEGEALYFASGASRVKDRRELSTLAAAGQPWMDVSRRAPLEEQAQSPFTAAPATDIELAANPYRLGWQYQSFGVWDVAYDGSRYVGGTTYGALTPASAVPTSGSATFSGKLAGFYLPAAGEGALATADLRVGANFGTRTLSLASSGTTLTRELAGSVAAANLDLAGTLTYAPGTNAFSGRLSNAAGTLEGPSRGQFYGPSAQELGGAFELRSGASREMFIGAYGGKR